MSVFAVEGAAGCGKTVRLMSTVGETLATTPLQEGQRVLALTFMHGARRRLNEKLRTIGGLAGRIECLTVDSFAQHLVRRWRGLARALGVPSMQADDYEAQCNAAGLLLERPEVAGWVATSFPVVLVDEAQDLKPERLRMITALAEKAALFVAADEFQCLDQGLRQNPCVAWMRAVCSPVVLTHVHRTSVADLLNAASAIRAGAAPASGKSFKIFVAPKTALTATFLANAIAWRKGGDVAVITPSIGGYAEAAVALVGEQPCGRYQNGPYTIRWEQSWDAEVQSLLVEFQLGETATPAETIKALQSLPASDAIRATMNWVQRQASAAGLASFMRDDVTNMLERQVRMSRQRLGARSSGLFTAMTVQQAKNREFDGVVVLWPYRVGGDPEHRRRLLYNAITRARRWCSVIVQGKDQLRAPPFA